MWMYKKSLFIILSFIFTSGCSASSPQPEISHNLFIQENKWEACYYYYAEKDKVIKEDCEASAIKISSCDGNDCFFQARFSHGNPWISECIMWGKLNIKTDKHAEGFAIAEYRGGGQENRELEDCEINFDISDKTMKISIKSGCSDWCKPTEFEFNNTYHINNTGGAVTG